MAESCYRRATQAWMSRCCPIVGVSYVRHVLYSDWMVYVLADGSEWHLRVEEALVSSEQPTSPIVGTVTPFARSRP